MFSIIVPVPILTWSFRNHSNILIFVTEETFLINIKNSWVATFFEETFFFTLTFENICLGVSDVPVNMINW